MGRMKIDQMRHWMAESLKLAEKGIGWAQPNPCVGAVIVKDGKIIGRGYHKRAGAPHAEVMAVRDAKKHGHHDLKNATLYVTLEPCSTCGRTGPCTEMIAHEKFKHVVIGALDLNPQHRGRGIHFLSKHGVGVTAGVLEDECIRINRPFFHWITTGRPWVIAKAAATLDGYLTTEPHIRTTITGPKAHKDAHRLRAICDAILIGAETLRVDDPQLTVRGVKHLRQPFRVIVTRSGKLPKNAKIYTDAYAEQTFHYQNRTWQEILTDLGKRGVVRLLVEGGGKVLNDLANKKWINEVTLYFAPTIITLKNKENLPHIHGVQKIRLTESSLITLGQDLRLNGISLESADKISKQMGKIKKTLCNSIKTQSLRKVATKG
jgi:diaminohydroxyphosphoribosylaminopyrimidine deaminase/5-amino-6-(5-phosphoribosylamino)uracil reductase